MTTGKVLCFTQLGSVTQLLLLAQRGKVRLGIATFGGKAVSPGSGTAGQVIDWEAALHGTSKARNSQATKGEDNLMARS